MSETTLARLTCDEATAKRLADSFSERFDAVATGAFEGTDGRWNLEIHFESPPDEDQVRLTLSQIAGADSAAAADLRADRHQGLGCGKSRGTKAGRGRPIHGAWRARPRAGCAEPHWDRDRGGACLRHRPSRNDARLLAGTGLDCQDTAPAASAGHRHRHRRARHRGGESPSASGAGERHRRGSSCDCAHQCAPQRRLTARGMYRGQGIDRTQVSPGRHGSIWCSPISCLRRSRRLPDLCGRCLRPARTSCCRDCLPSRRMPRLRPTGRTG